jgi:hypothetical protein
MSELLYESPLIVGFTGLALTIIALVVWIKGGFRNALYTACVLAVLTVVLLFLNLNIQTDREQIDQLLHDVAAAVQRNDLPTTLSYIHPNAVEGLQRAKNEMPKYEFTEARITGIKSIEVKPKLNPPLAVAEFYVAVSLNSGGRQVNGIRRFVRATLTKRDGRWLVSDYEHFEPTTGFRQ